MEEETIRRKRMDVNFTPRYLFINGLNDETVTVDMYDFLTRDNIEFRLGVLMNALSEDVDTELLQGYFLSAGKYFELDPEDSISKAYKLRSNKRLFEIKYVMKAGLKRGLSLTGKDIEMLMNSGTYFIAASSATTGIPEQFGNARFRKLMKDVENTAKDFPEIHYGTILSDDKTSHDTVIAWTDQSTAHYLERTFIEEASDARIEKTISVHDGKAFMNTWEGPGYTQSEYGKYDSGVFAEYRASLMDEEPETDKPLIISERCTENIRENYLNDQVQIDAMQEILEQYDLGTVINASDIDSFNWKLLLPIALQDERII